MTTELQNKVWSILPKEFKKEVKEIYLNAVVHHPCGYNHKTDLLKYLFGRHNLTSNAEEDVMLTCEKSKVQRAYNTSREIVKAENPDSLMYSMHTQIMCVLENIFGSKCLPDAREFNFASTESKPAEPKNEVVKMKPIKSHVSVYLATKEEDEEFRTLLYENGFMWISGTALISLSNWDSDYKPRQIYHVYPDKTVTYLGKRTEETLTFTEFKRRYFGEDVNLSQETVNCDKQFDTILKDDFRNERRLNIATQITASIYSDYETVSRFRSIEALVRKALDIADTLISEAEKGGINGED